MKIDFSNIIYQPDGKTPFKENDKIMTLGKICSIALQVVDPKAEPKDKARAGFLSMQTWSEELIEVSSEDVTMMKSSIARTISDTVIIYQATKLLEEIESKK